MVSKHGCQGVSPSEPSTSEPPALIFDEEVINSTIIYLLIGGFIHSPASRRFRYNDYDVEVY
jgi:hypothetical protein